MVGCPEKVNKWNCTVIYYILNHFPSTCVSAFVEILQSLQCKIFQYTFLRRYLMKLWYFFSLWKIQQPTWLQPDHKELRPSEMRLWDPCIMKLKNALWCMVYCFENHLLGYLLNSKRIKIALNIYILLIKLLKPWSKLKSTKYCVIQVLRTAI